MLKPCRGMLKSRTCSRNGYAVSCRSPLLLGRQKYPIRSNGLPRNLTTATQAREVAAVAFGRAAFAAGLDGRHQPAVFLSFAARFDACFGLTIEGASHGRGTADLA